MTTTGAWAVRVPPGYRVGGWTVTAGIATGSWGSVYDARWTGPEPPPGPDRVALKVLPTGTVTPRQVNHLRDMASREVRAHRLGPHPRLIRCFEVRTIDDPDHPDLDGATVLVLERADRSLADLLRSGPAPAPDAGRLVEEICAGLAHMHAHGWVHGDLKPGNVLLMADGSVRLADFGLTAELEGTHGYLPPIASPDYVPPERWTERLGEHGLAIRPTADVWALGVTAYMLFTGRHPFPGAGSRARALAAAGHAGELGFPDAVPPGWRTLIRDCLAPTHAARSRHDTGSLLVRIRELRRGTPVRRPRGRVGLLAGSVVAVVAAVTVAVPLIRDARRAGDAAARPLSTATPAATATAEYRPDLLRTGVGIPAQYRELIVTAGTTCDAPGLSPALVAAMLKVESDFDPDLSDPARDEYGIARWTPRVLAHYLPRPQPDPPAPPFPPALSIPAVGRFLCYLSPRIAGVPGDPALLLAAAYRTSSSTVVAAGGVPSTLRAHVDRVGEYHERYRPGR
ncbi:protein kinase domain-containing protein [Virgisporangium aurantiacum]|uniref:Protein kinase domain-containing protein n=1 Tax=Virgisporangium aurantiacum TaxID=175570 RepID=A0A8J3Z4Z6_9ACTN|nr:protein kinase [Virgisporangium aurantiacum]GIJ56527.1 hypothetical protein Vau01_040430 [Virgisporangium aurantiacum]